MGIYVENTKLLTTEEVAKILRIEVQTVRQLVKLKKIRHCKIGTGKIRKKILITHEMIDEYLQSCEVQASEVALPKMKIPKKVKDTTGKKFEPGFPILRSLGVDV